jgi:hypothetical protein
VVLFSMIKWSCFRLSRFQRNDQNGPVFGDQMALFSVDKNNWGECLAKQSVSYLLQSSIKAGCLNMTPQYQLWGTDGRIPAGVPTAAVSSSGGSLYRTERSRQNAPILPTQR